MPLWTLLAALVLIPVIGVLSLAGVLVVNGVDRAHGASRVAAQVRSVAVLEAAAVALDQEIVPSIGELALASPKTLEALGIPPALTRLGSAAVASQTASARAATDSALRAVVTSSRTAAERALGAQITSQLRTLRAGPTGGASSTSDLASLYRSYEALAGLLSDAEARESNLGGDHDASMSTTSAILDVEQVSGLAKSASAELGPFFASIEPAAGAGSTAAPGPSSYAAAHEAYEAQVVLMGRLLQPALEADWDAVRALPSVTTADAALSQGPATVHAGLSEVASWGSLLADDAARDAAYAGLVNTAVTMAEHSVARDHASADSSRAQALMVTGVVLALTVLVTLLLVRSITRSLRSLARQAQLVNEGTLVDVTIDGPREVRTVGSALGNAVSTLRRVQDQAEAVAEGDLGDASLAAALPGRLGEVVHASVQRIVQSLREREELQSALAYQAAHDSLTGLPNRAQAQRLTDAALHRGRRAGAATGLLFVDLDGFKVVNDRHGHACGDGVLRTVAQRLRETVRIGDTVARLGGDEFVVLAESVSGERDLLDLADRLIAAVSGPIAIAQLTEPVTVGASVGIAVALDSQVDIDRLFAEADAAVYRAKALGRGRWEVFDEPLRAQLAERAEIESGLAQALSRQELVLHYQPVVDGSCGRLVGTEALVRWERPGHGLVPPDRFIPIAEQSRLICELGRWVLFEATRQNQEWWLRSGLGVHEASEEQWRVGSVAVNISGRHLADPRVVDDVRDALAASGLAPHLLVVEVTETVVVDDPVAIEHLAALASLGVRSAIDDFGTGYTSIGQLGHLPVHCLKIDRSFVMSDDPAQRALVTLMIQVAHNLGLTVVAEGVERDVDLERLRAQGCDLMQGYLFSRPLPADRMLAFADDWSGDPQRALD
jgi:diguanylate cyclase (GGDEF)-like protein